MQIIKQSHDLFGETPIGYTEAIKRIELAGRNCYKSEHRIHDDSAEKFVANIIGEQHLSVVEHSNFVLRTMTTPTFPESVKKYFVGEIDSKYISVIVEGGHVYIGGNFRAFMECFNIPDIKELLNNWYEYLDNLVMEYPLMRVIDNDDIPMDLKRISARFITDRAVLAEFTRHRPDIVFSVESQRYCAYRDDVTLVIPHHYLDKYDMFINDTLPAESNEQMWLEHMRSVEEYYQFFLTKKTADMDIIDANPDKKYILVNDDTHYFTEKAEEARSVLPNSTAVDMIVTATMPEWRHIFNLRTSKAAYKQFRLLMNPFQDEFKQKGWN